ncbi:amino acid ABC transporter substrate-binding protein [Erwinia aphidicola]|jgi:putative amino-acid transport system substrate-binding protein|uniref:transporter substrate-binding domain-containing protein n=2 Tax=Erwinia aphidicola TaxID=68334 RepID=UPI000C190CEE|nr:transporter substrate-binding domain-containing protein [Erwinia aphidicola]MBD1378327.1 transporter substrate-binding domain-containing protein [Erwinia aphidicola]PIJ52193.1 amino acid ABC transporter substrate-binding protein [Erwinia sp. OLMDLW33]CAH0294498.1 putative amino-acid-binding protein YxeM [Erwinia aphidicola]
MKLVKLALIACALPLLYGCDKPADSSSDQPVLRVGATPDGYPHYFVENKVIKGFSADILQAVADKIHYKIEWVTSDWVGVLGSLETGKVDTVGNFADTPERRKKYDYSVPYYYSAAALAVSENNHTIHGLNDMAGKSVAAELGSNYAKVLKEFDPQNKIRLVTFEGMDVIVSSIAQGKVDAFVSGQVILLGQIKKKHLPLKVVGETFGEKQVALPFRKDERGEALKAKVDVALEELRAEGTLKKISEKWFDSDLSVSSQPVKGSR